MAVGTVVTRLPALHSRIKRSVEPSTLNELGDRPDQSYRRAVQAQTLGGAPDGLGVKVMTPQPDVRMRFRRFGDHPMDLAFVLSHPAAVLPVFKRSGEHPMDQTIQTPPDCSRHPGIQPGIPIVGVGIVISPPDSALRSNITLRQLPAPRIHIHMR